MEFIRKKKSLLEYEVGKQIRVSKKMRGAWVVQAVKRLLISAQVKILGGESALSGEST